MKSRIWLVLIIVSLFFIGAAFAQNDNSGNYGEENNYIEGPPPDESPPLPQEETPPLPEREQAPLRTPNQAAQSPASATVVAASNKISLDIKGMDIVDVLKIIATRAAMNIVIGRNVTGRITLFLKDVDIHDVFEIIILANDLAYEKKGDLINVMTSRDYELIYGERFSDKKQLINISLKYAKAVTLVQTLNQVKSNIGRVVMDEPTNTLILMDTPEKLAQMKKMVIGLDRPLETKIFNLNYATAEKLSPKLQESLTKGTGYLRIDERTNKLAVTDYPEKLEEISKVVAAFDEKPMQVLIDAQVIELKPSDKFEMGVDWNWFIKKYFHLTASLPVATSGVLAIGTASTNPTETGEYKGIVTMLRTLGDAKILSSPRIMAVNNQEAKILVGTKDAYITSTTSQSGETAVTSQSVNFVDVGIKLYVTPNANRAGFVTMKIKPEVSSAKRTSIKSEDKITEVPIVTTSESETTVVIKDGVTIIIGGLKKDERNLDIYKIPVLGDIPYIGHLFRKQSDEVKKTELIILLTPHIMSGESPITDFAEVKPVDGAVAAMEKGEIVTKKYSSSKQDQLISALVPKAAVDYDYYEILTDKIIQFARQNSPLGKTGEVGLDFSVASDGRLKGEPKVVNASDATLVPFAVKAIKDAAPFPAFPKELLKSEERFSITLDYE